MRGWEVETKLLRECRRLFRGWWWRTLCRWSVSCLVCSFWLWTLRRISGGAMPDSTYRSGVAVGRMHPAMRRHVSFSVVSASLRCVERAQKGQQYSAAERHSAVAVVLVMWGNAPQFVPSSFLRRLFLEESFARVLSQWFR